MQCTGCRYCLTESKCPKSILILELFAAYNARKRFGDWNPFVYYGRVLTANGHGKASDCIGCGKCEKVCPQHIEIRKSLADVAAEFDRR